MFPSPAWGDPVADEWELPRSVENELLAMEMFFEQFPEARWIDWLALSELWSEESEWNDRAKNPNSSAFGIPQALTKTHKLRGTDYMTDPRAQIQWGLDYIKSRYGTPVEALTRWREREEIGGSGWY